MPDLPSLQSRPSLIDLKRTTTATLDLLRGWTPAEPLPEGLSSTTIYRAIDAAAELTRGANPVEIAATVALIVAHAARYNIACDDAEIDTSYAQMCATMPPDLMAEGVQQVLQGWTDSFRVPAPGHIWDAVKRDYQERQSVLLRLQTAAMIGERKGFRDDVEEPAGEPQSLDELLADVRASLAQVPKPKGVR